MGSKTRNLKKNVGMMNGYSGRGSEFVVCRNPECGMDFKLSWHSEVYFETEKRKENK